MALMDVTTFRKYVSTALEDSEVQTLLDAAEQAILRYAGPYIASSGADDTINELIGPVHGDLLPLSRRAASIETVSERTGGWWTPTTLAADDYEIRSSGTVLRRLHTGTNPSHHWHGRVSVTYAPLDDLASREIVQLELVKLDIAFNPTLASQTVGSWAETYNTGKPYPEQRTDVLASLVESVGIW